MKKRSFYLILILLILIGNTAFASFFMEMIDVGAGDCFLLRCDNTWIMIDTGPEKALPRVEQVLDELGVTSLDMLLITHPHPDHAGNLEAILKKLPVTRVCVSGSENDSPFVESQNKAITDAGLTPVPLFRGNRFTIGDCEAVVLWPEAEPLELENDRSVVLKLIRENFSMLFMGDAELETEHCLLAGKQDLPLKANLIKLGHHGMATSSTYPFIAEVSPDFAFASCGSREKNATLSPLTVENLEECGVTYLFSTRENGNVILAIDDTGLLTIR